MEEKKQIRKRILKLRSEIPANVQDMKSMRICDKVLSDPYYQQADMVLCYMDFHDEAQTKSIIRDALSRGKKVAVPRVSGDTMDFYLIHSAEDLEPGYFGIPEPKETCEQTEPNEVAVMIVPGTVFDPSGNRIGYGKGFYDRYLASHPVAHTIGIAFEEQIVDALPAEETDWRLDTVITDAEIYRRQTDECDLQHGVKCF